jgi:hypothetical protein
MIFDAPSIAASLSQLGYVNQLAIHHAFRAIARSIATKKEKAMDSRKRFLVLALTAAMYPGAISSHAQSRAGALLRDRHR